MTGPMIPDLSEATVRRVLARLDNVVYHVRLKLTFSEARHLEGAVEEGKSLINKLFEELNVRMCEDLSLDRDLLPEDLLPVLPFVPFNYRCSLCGGWIPAGEPRIRVMDYGPRSRGPVTTRFDHVPGRCPSPRTEAGKQVSASKETGAKHG